MASETAGRGGAAAVRTPAGRWGVVLAACAGQFLVVLDVSVINVALPSLRADLGLSATGLQWVVNAYTLTFAGFMLLGGRAADLFGRKRVFVTGLVLFALTSLAGGLAQEPWQLVAARALQGVGAAALAPATLTILTTTFPEGPARTRAIGTWTAVGAGGGAMGGLVGGVLTEFLSWRWVLLVNVPIGALVLVVAAVWVVERRGQGRPRLDVLGAVLVTSGIGALAYGIVNAETHGWGSARFLAPFLGGVVLLGLFLLVERRTVQPLIPLGLFRLRSVASANTVLFVNGSAMVCMWYFFSLHMQNVLDYPPLQAGLGFLPMSVSIVLGSKAAPWIMVRVGERALAVAGTLTAAAGYLWAGTMTAGDGFAVTVLGPGTLMALGAGLASTTLASVATADAAPQDAGLVSGMINTSRTLGGALGLAVLSTVAASRIQGDEQVASLASGYALAFLTGGLVLVGCAVLGVVALPRPRRRAASPAAGATPNAPAGDRSAPAASAASSASGGTEPENHEEQTDAR